MKQFDNDSDIDMDELEVGERVVIDGDVYRVKVDDFGAGPYLLKESASQN